MTAVSLTQAECQATARDATGMRPQVLAQLGWRLYQRGWRCPEPLSRAHRPHHRAVQWGSPGRPPCPGRVALLLAVAALRGAATPPGRVVVPATVSVRLPAPPGPRPRERLAVALARGVTAASYRTPPPGALGHRLSVRLSPATRTALAEAIARYGGTAAGWVRSLLVPAAPGPMTPEDCRRERAHRPAIRHDQMTDKVWARAAGQPGPRSAQQQERLARWASTAR